MLPKNKKYEVKTVKIDGKEKQVIEFNFQNLSLQEFSEGLVYFKEYSNKNSD